MKKNVTFYVCNGCRLESSIIGEFSEYEVTSGKKTTEIHLCPKCATTMESFLVGTVPVPPKAVRKAPAKKIPTKAQLAKYIPCPECDRTFKNKNGLGIHIARTHKK